MTVYFKALFHSAIVAVRQRRDRPAAFPTACVTFPSYHTFCKIYTFSADSLVCHYCYKPHRLLTADTQHSTQLNFVLRFIKRVILLMNDPCCVYSCTYIHERTRGLRMGYDTEQKFSKLISSLKCNLTR